MKHKERVGGFRGIIRGRPFYLCISILMLLLLFPTNGYPLSWEVAHIMGGEGYRSVATGDFNNDGRQDTIAAGANGADIWLQGLYFPCPAAVWTYGCYTATTGMGGSYDDVVVADFNNDGNLDFAAVGESGVGDIMLGDGDQDGDFSINWTDETPAVFQSVQNKSVKTFDYKNDGHIDIITGGGDSGIRLFENIDPSDLSLLAPTTITPDNFYDQIALADFNNDALTDIVAVSNSIGVRVWSGIGPPGWSFTPLPAESVPAVTAAKYISVAAADLDLDGNSDIVAGSENGIHIWYGDGKGSWLPQTVKYPGTTLPTEEDIYQAVVIADVDRDRFPDIIGAQNGGGVLVWFGDPDHVWVSQTSVFKSGDYLGVSVIDFNIDGLLDVVSVSPNSMKVSLQIREREVEPLQWQRGASGSDLTGYQGVDSADFNQDGIPDVVAANNDRGVHLWLGKKGGGWVRAVDESSPPSPADVGQYYDVVAADFNNDGLMDVAASHNSGEGVKVWLGQFNISTGTATGGGPSSLVDTSKNWVPGEWAKYQLKITKGTGKGQTRVVEWNNNNTLFIYSDWSIIPGSDSEYKLSRYFWSSDITGSDTGPTTLGNHYHLTAADLDHDGQKDLIAGSDIGVKVWFNDGPTSIIITWSADSGPPTSGGYNGVAVGDVNEDGDPDIIAGNCEVGGIDVWFGNGNRAWWDAYLESPPVGDRLGCFCDADGCYDGRDGIEGNGQISITVLSPTIAQEWSVAVVNDTTPNNEVWEVKSWTWSGPYTHLPAITNQNYTSNFGEVSFMIASGPVTFRRGDRFLFRTASGSDGIGPRPERLGKILGMTRLYDGVATGDFDRDGNLDIVAGNAGGWGVQVWFGNGKGEWRMAEVTPPAPVCTNAGAWFITTNQSFVNAGSDRLIGELSHDLRYWYWPEGAGPAPPYGPYGYGPPFNVGVKTNAYMTSSSDWEITTDKVPDEAKVEEVKAGEMNQGKGTIEVLVSCATTPYDSWTITISGDTSSFSVIGVCSGTMSPGKVDEFYMSDNFEIALTVSSATDSPFAPGDYFTFRTVGCDPTFKDNQPGRPSEHIGYFGTPYIAYWNRELAFTAFGIPALKPNPDKYHFTTYYPGIITDGTYYDVAVADLNRDGYDDIVAANKEDGGIQVWTNNGRGVWLKNPKDGALEPWVTEESPINIGNYSGVAIVDFDQDGLLDIVGAHDITSGVGIEVWRQVIDWEPPQVIESSIAEGANDVPIESEIIFTFNEEIDHTTLNPETVIVEGSESGELPATIIYYTGDYMLLISPEKDFRVGEKVTITLKGVIKDLVGNSLDGDEDGVAEGSPIDDFILTFNTKDNIPQGLTAIADDEEMCIALSWYPNPEGNLGWYYIYRDTVADAFTYGEQPTDEPFLILIEAGIENHCDYTATREVTYYYAITAVNDNIINPDESGFSETVTAVLLDKIPAAPATLTAAVIGYTNVTLTWEPTTTNDDGSPIVDLAGYNLYRSEVSGASYNLVNTTGLIIGISFNDSGLEEGGIYYYIVSAVDIYGNESLDSVPPQPHPELRVSLLYELAPAAPGNVRRTQRDPITVWVGWDAVTTNEDGSPIGDLVGYNVYRTDVSCTDFTLPINTTGPIAGTTEFVDGDLTTGDTYCYVVTAVDNVGKESEESTPVTITLADIVPVPENLVAFPVGEDSVKLIWEAPEYEISLAGYNIYYAISPGGPTVKVNVAPIPGTTLLVTGLTECQYYYFKVTAVEEGGVRESDLNDCEEVWARPHIPGDFDCDGDVDLDDYPALEAAFGSTYGQARYSADVDLDQNLRIDGLDLADFARRLGT